MFSSEQWQKIKKINKFEMNLSSNKDDNDNWVTFSFKMLLCVVNPHSLTLAQMCGCTKVRLATLQAIAECGTHTHTHTHTHKGSQPE